MGTTGPGPPGRSAARSGAGTVAGVNTVTCTLLFLLREDEVLLGWKKRGFGAGRYNGVGGKVEPSETLEEAAIRECREEIGVTPLELTTVAELEFLMDVDRGPWLIRAHVFTSTLWDAEPVETSEFAPRWFPLDQVPYDRMWSDDRHWLPRVLAGESLRGRFEFDSAERLLSAQVTAPRTLLQREAQPSDMPFDPQGLNR
jgi:8-oxo-dGTP diphosphatase